MVRFARHLVALIVIVCFTGVYSIDCHGDYCPPCECGSDHKAECEDKTPTFSVTLQREGTLQELCQAPESAICRDCLTSDAAKCAENWAHNGLFGCVQYIGCDDCEEWFEECPKCVRCWEEPPSCPVPTTTPAPNLDSDDSDDHSATIGIIVVHAFPQCVELLKIVASRLLVSRLRL